MSVEDTKLARKADVQLARENQSMKVITFDMQQTFPTPHLETGVVFYKRQLWTYNLGVHDYTNNDGIMLMWPEGTASRGSQEVGSCLMKYCKSLPDQITHLTAYSDNCAGQNKNFNLVLFWNHMLKQLITNMLYPDTRIWQAIVTLA